MLIFGIIQCGASGPATSTRIALQILLNILLAEGKTEMWLFSYCSAISSSKILQLRLNSSIPARIFRNFLFPIKNKAALVSLGSELFSITFSDILLYYFLNCKCVFLIVKGHKFGKKPTEHLCSSNKSSEFQLHLLIDVCFKYWSFSNKVFLKIKSLKKKAILLK